MRADPLALDDVALRKLRDLFEERLITPVDSSYDATRRVWNARVDSRPAALVRCQSEKDVIAAVEVARTTGVLTAVRGGSHSVAGHGVCEAGLVIDLGGLDSVVVDPDRRSARVGGGALWRAVDEATEGHGLATVGGQISSTGVGGLTLGGGVGWLMRRFGLTVDNLLSARVITADGTVHEVGPDREPDLFWAIRGGGGNFGIVTEFEFRLHPVAEITAGVMLYPAGQAGTMLRAIRDYAPEEPRDLTTMVLILAGSRQPFIPAELQGKPIAVFGVCHIGDEAAAERDLAPLRAVGPPALDTIARVKYTTLQRHYDNGSLAGSYNYWRSPFLSSMPDAAIEAIAEHAARMTSPISQVLITHMEGAVADVAETATPFRFRQAPYYLEILAKWAEPGDDAHHLAWADSFATAMEPYSTGGGYINFLGEAKPGEVEAAYGSVNLARLRSLKRRYDPNNLFRVNHNIEPAAI
jgi:FAD/FMN-containing dehydrogenase